MKMTQTAFVDSLVDRFDIQYETSTPTWVESDLELRGFTRRREIGHTSRQLIVYCGSRNDATGYSECGEGSGPTCPQSGRAALEGGSEDNYLPQGNQVSGDCVPAEDLRLSLFADAGYADRCSYRRSVSGVTAMLRNTAECK